MPAEHHTLLQHGAFTAADTVASAHALAAFSLGLPAYILIKVLVPGFHARGDTRTPVRIALVAMLANLVGNLVLIWPLQHVGLALSTANFAARGSGATSIGNTGSWLVIAICLSFGGTPAQT